jgi:signal peptidase II
LHLRAKSPYLLVILAIIALDQAVKLIVVRTIPHLFWKDVVPGFFRLWHVRNSGAVWGILSDAGGRVPRLITLLAVAAFAVVIGVFFKTAAGCRLELTALTFIMGGALGNIVDRVRLGYVVDFLDVYVGRHHWPTFNAADSFISVGVLLLAWSLWRGRCTPS